MDNAEVVTIQTVVGILLHMANGQLLIMEEEKFPLDRKWIKALSSEIFEVLVTPIGPNQVNIGLKKFSDNPFSPHETSINAEHAVFVHSLTKESDLGKAFIKAKSGIILA